MPLTAIKVLIAGLDSASVEKLKSSLQADSGTFIVTANVYSDQLLKEILDKEFNVICITLDLLKKTGIGLVKSLVDAKEARIVVIPADSTDISAQLVMKCLELGVIDYAFPTDSLSEKVTYAANANISKLKRNVRFLEKNNMKVAETRAVCIGASTGGPAVLEILLPALSQELKDVVFVAQHMPEKFTKSMTHRIKSLCKANVLETSDGEIIQTGLIYIAQGSANTWISHNEFDFKTLNVSDNHLTSLVPSINILFSSIAEEYRDKAIAVILTGMGNDGLDGCIRIKAAGGKIIVQNEETSVVFGMGKEVIKAGIADYILPIEEIASKIKDLLNARRF